MNTHSYRHCTLCPRMCGVDRSAGQRGVCGMSDVLLAGRASLHEWEEPCLVGQHGSGTVFFSGCSLGCVYCQNRALSQQREGVPLDEGALADTFLALQEAGAANINLVTATPHLPRVLKALKLAKTGGLTLPVLYNTSGYERVDTLAALEGLVDIYLPDLKTLSQRRAALYMNAPDYPAVAKAAIAEMVRQRGAPVLNAEGDMTSGVIVRHLVLPKGEQDARHVLRHLASYGDEIYISLMSQYTPIPGLEAHGELGRRVSPLTYRRLVTEAALLGITQMYTQQQESARESFIPLFDGRGLVRGNQ